MRDAERAAIVRAAKENGIEPSAALAIAERESNFNPTARSSKTIAGMYQMRGDLRQKYGVGDSSDPYAQAKGWGTFFKDVKRDMAAKLGRDPTDAEGYLGHHFGAGRAARMMQMDPATPVDQVFTPYERSVNPHFDKAGTVGALNSSVLSDIDKRQTKFGAPPADFSDAGAPVDEGNNPVITPLKPAQQTAALDFSPLGTPADVSNPTANLNMGSAPAASSAPDFSQFGVAV